MNLDEIFELSRRYFQIQHKEYVRSFFKADVFKHRMSILIGPRGVGKTTSLIQYLLKQAGGDHNSKEVLYVPADHYLLSNTSLYEVAVEFELLGGKIIVFDEIHKYPNWSQELKSIYDTYPDLKVIVSGSSILEISKGSHDLSRRAPVYYLNGLSFREYIELNLGVELKPCTLIEILEGHVAIAQDIVDLVAKHGQKVLSLFVEYCRTGYYPYFLEIKDIDVYNLTLQQNVSATIESDLTAVYPSLNGSSIRKIKQLLSYVSQTAPFVPNMKNLKNTLDIGDERTLKTYLKYLEDAGLVRLLMSATKKIKQLETPEKIYLANPNQLFAIAAESSNIGTLRELFFLSMVSQSHDVTFPKKGDFMVDHKYVFEIGGRKKSFEQIKSEKNAYLGCDNIEVGFGNKIPLWLFGFVY